MIRRFFKSLKSGTEHLNYGRHILEDWGAEYLDRRSRPASGDRGPLRVLDIGCGHGTDLLNIRAEAERRMQADGRPFELELHGFENYPPYVKELKAAGISVHSIDIERDEYPGADASFDLIVANQVLEHTKELFWIFAEVTRLLKPGGLFLVGVPNLASLHNRLLLFFGQQPTCQQNMSAHVRGFTRPDLRNFAETGGYFKLTGRAGSNFYPFPPALSRPLAKIFPSLAWGLFVRFERTHARGDFLECLTADILETPFYGSPQNPAKRSRKSAAKSGAKKPGAKAKSRR